MTNENERLADQNCLSWILMCFWGANGYKKFKFKFDIQLYSFWSKKTNEVVCFSKFVLVYELLLIKTVIYAKIRFSKQWKTIEAITISNLRQLLYICYTCTIDCNKAKYPMWLKTEVVVAQNQQVLLTILPLWIDALNDNNFSVQPYKIFLFFFCNRLWFCNYMYLPWIHIATVSIVIIVLKNIF